MNGSIDRRPVRVGLIGLGGIADFVHLPGLARLPDAESYAGAEPDPARREAMQRKYGLSRTYADAEALLADEAVDAVVVCTANRLHRPLTLAALAAGKHVLCEKPLAMRAEDAAEMLAAAERTDRLHMVSFLYRLVPAMRYLKYVVDEGMLGEIRHLRAVYLQDSYVDPSAPIEWRQVRAESGSGTLGDIGSHLIDLARYLVGEIGAVAGLSRTFTTERPSVGSAERVPVDTDDATAFLTEFSNGASGVFEVSRCALGYGRSKRDYQRIELNGTLGSAVYELPRPFELRVSAGRVLTEDHRWARLPVPERFLVEPGSPRKPADDEPLIGFRYDIAHQFVGGIRAGRSVGPTFVDGLRAQQVVDAVLAATKARCWQPVPAMRLG